MVNEHHAEKTTGHRHNSNNHTLYLFSGRLGLSAWFSSTTTAGSWGLLGSLTSKMAISKSKYS